MSKNSQKQHIRNHYIPQMLLRKFANSNEQLHVYTKKDDYLANVEDCCVEKHFYGIEIDIKITQLEAESIQQHLKDIILLQDEGTVDTKIATKIIEHFILRGNYKYRFLSEISAIATKHIAKRFTISHGFTKKYIYEKSIKELGKRLDSLIMEDLNKRIDDGVCQNIALQLDKYEWKIIEAIENDYLLLPDTLILYRNRKNGKVAPLVHMENYCFHNQESTIIFPISKNKILIGSNTSYSKKFILKSFNKWAVSCAYKHFYAPPNSENKKYKNQIGKVTHRIISQNVQTIVDSFTNEKTIEITASNLFALKNKTY